MRRLVYLICLLFIMIPYQAASQVAEKDTTSSQEMIDVIYLKDGTIIKGKIVDRTEAYLIVQKDDGDLSTHQTDQVVATLQEEAPEEKAPEEKASGSTDPVSVYEGRLKLHTDDPSWKLVLIEIPSDPAGRLRVLDKNSGRVYFASKDDSAIRRGSFPKPGLSGWQSAGLGFSVAGAFALVLSQIMSDDEDYEYIEATEGEDALLVGLIFMGAGLVMVQFDDYYPVLILPGPMYLRAPEHVLQRAARASGTTVSLRNPLRPLPALPKYTLGISPMRRRGAFALATVRF